MRGIISFIFYITVFAVSIGCLCYKKNNKGLNLINAIGILILVVMAAMRYNVGTDYQQYLRNFVRYYRMSWVRIFFDRDDGWGLAALVKILYGIGGEKLCFGVCSFLTVLPVYYTLKNDYPKLPLSVSLFWFLTTGYLQSFNLVSQYIAISIIFFGMKYIYRGEPRKYLLTILVAFLFHKSALIAIILYFLWDNSNECAVQGKRRLIIIIGTVFSVYFYHEIIQYLTQHLSFFRAYSYFIAIEESRNRDFFLSLLQLFIVMLCLRNLKKQDNRNEMLYLMLLIATLIGFTGFTHPQFKRIAFYFSVPATTILIGYITKVPILFGGKRVKSAIFPLTYTIFRFILVHYIIGSLGYSIRF